MEKQPSEEVRTVRVFGDHYRCNWWVRDASAHTMFANSVARISRSRFLRASRTGDQLVIEEIDRN
jgi:hypothetical protein